MATITLCNVLLMLQRQVGRICRWTPRLGPFCLLVTGSDVKRILALDLRF